MPLRLQCNLCGDKSIAVESLPPTAKEQQAVDEFRLQHEATCGFDSIGRQTPPTQCGPFGSIKPEPHSALKPHGHAEYTGPYGEIQEVDTISCCHCRRHMEVRSGFDRARGFCMKCNAITCGSPRCAECRPHEHQLENVERGLPALSPQSPKILVPELLLAENEQE